MVTPFSRDIFNTIIWNIKKCSTNRRFNIFVSEAGGNEADIFSLNKTSCELTPISQVFGDNDTIFMQVWNLAAAKMKMVEWAIQSVEWGCYWTASELES